MGLIKFLKLVKCFGVVSVPRAPGTVSHMTEAEYLKVNLPVSSNFWSVEIKLSGIFGVIGVDSGCRC